MSQPETKLMFAAVKSEKSKLWTLTPVPPSATRYLAIRDRRSLRALCATQKEGDA